MKKTVILVVVILLAAAGVGYVMTSDNDENKINTDTSQPTSDGGEETNTDGGEAATATDKVSIEGFAFQPAAITVKKGTTVTWTNKDSVGHTVTPDQESDAFKASSMLSQNDTYTFTFDTPGTYSYHCEPHPSMQGTVTVTE